MQSTYSISKAQSNFPGLVREVSDKGAIAITRHNETVAYVISRERMEAITETLEILGAPEPMQALRDFEAGKTHFQGLEDLDRDEG